MIARETGLGRESLYKALSSSGNPEFATVRKVVRSLGLKLHVTPLQPAASAIEAWPVGARTTAERQSATARSRRLSAARPSTLRPSVARSP